MSRLETIAKRLVESSKLILPPPVTPSDEEPIAAGGRRISNPKPAADARGLRAPRRPARRFAPAAATN